MFQRRASLRSSVLDLSQAVSPLSRFEYVFDPFSSPSFLPFLRCDPQIPDPSLPSRLTVLQEEDRGLTQLLLVLLLCALISYS